MTNITLSIDDKVYKKMKRYSEIKWSELVRRVIEKHLNQLDKVEGILNDEGILTMLASEEVLKKDWLNEEDERWDNV